MDSKILAFVNKLEGWKTAIKNLHWNSSSLSQHKECDEIADEIAEIQDVISEVEQGISGNLPYNQLKGEEYHITTIQKFLEDVISETTKFYKELEGMGDNYIGLHSECESFLTKMQREVYLINFTLKEDFKRKYKAKVNEEVDPKVLEYFKNLNKKHEFKGNYSEEERKRNFGAITQGTPEDRNPAYKAAKEKQIKNESIKLTENELNSVINEAMSHVIGKFINEIGDTYRGQYELGRLAQRKKLNGIANKQDDEQSGTNDVFKYANQRQYQAPNDIEGRRNAFYNGWHSSEGNKQYGYNYFKSMDESCNENCESEMEIQGGQYKDQELDFTHFAVNKQTGLIVDGWGYAGYDSEDLKMDKNGYFFDDLRGNGYNPKAYTILTFNYCSRRGIDPNNDKQYWSNTGVYPLSQEIEMKNQGINPFEEAKKEHPDWFVD